MRVEFVAATWQVEVETQARVQDPPLYVSLPRPVTMSGAPLKEWETVIALYA